MVNSSKVLTVSYGTFSCTLEGFDDSFDTMKVIAEYFRDLAADDRYFGAEPPTPDAEMLARIAEREVSRHVEAHQDGGNIVLRTALPVAGDLAENVDELVDAAKAEEAAAEEAKRAEIAEQAALEEKRRLAEEAQILADAKSAAEADAKAIKEAAEKAKLDAEAAEELRAAEEARLAQEQAEAQAALEAKQKAEAEARAEADRLAEIELQAEAKRVAQERKAAEEAEAQAEQEQHEPDSVAAKLARIRAVVGKPDDTPETPDFSEDEHADDIMQGQSGDTDLEDILELDEKPAATESDAATKDAISGVMAKLSDSAPSKIAEEDLTAPEIDAEIEEIEVEAETPKAPLRARVIKMKREEFEAAIASGDIEEENDDATDADSVAEATQDTSLSRDDEDELARELAAVEAELAGVPIEEELTSEYIEEEQSLTEDHFDDVAASNARNVDDLAVAPDVEMDRLMDQASSELEEPDGKKRRNALGHLRAAVASARADKQSAPHAEPLDETLDYRDDLESAVQPRRQIRRLSADGAAAATARPPLKLVAEQRVDAPVSAPQPTERSAEAPAPVRPRRIKVAPTPSAPAEQTSEEDFTEEGGTFNEFAEEMGATELPDLLEAAAAYLAYVEGKDQFSRPQLMTKVRMVQEDNFSREDGLRSFGQLLRQGKIEKISGGRFTVSDRISFKPDTRAVG